LILATALLVAVPGPVVALVVATSLARGVRQGLLTVAGATSGVALQLVFVVVGLAALVDMLSGLLTWIRWAGVAYLVFLGLHMWRPANAEHDSVGLAVEPVGHVLLKGFVVAFANPKTFAFHVAFLPQFVGREADVATELALVGTLYLTVLAAGDGVWALFAGGARRFFLRYGRWCRRLSGAVLIGAGVGLALARRP